MNTIAVKLRNSAKARVLGDSRSARRKEKPMPAAKSPTRTAGRFSLVKMSGAGTAPL
jgi:hypothetical protein